MGLNLREDARRKIKRLGQLLSEENEHINDDEKDALISVLEEYPQHLEQKINILDAIINLQRTGIISKETRFELIEKYKQMTTGPHDQFFELMKDIIGRCPLHRIVSFLRSIQCDRFAHDIEKELPIQVMNRADMSDSCRLLEFFHAIKRHFDDNIFNEPRNDVHDIAVRRLTSLTEEPQRHSERALQSNAEQYVAGKWVEINTLRDASFEERLAVLDDMMQNVPHDIPSASMYAQLLYLSKRAVSYALIGNWSKAMEDIKYAKGNMINCEDHFVKILMYHDFQFIYRLKYAAAGTAEDMQMVFRMGNRAMDLAQHINLDSCTSWERLFKLNMAMSILGIGPKLDITVNDMSPECKTTAKALVDQLGERKYYDGMPSREEISFHLCRARLYEEKEDWKMARDFAMKAMCMAKDGTPFDIDRKHISDYTNYLHSKDTTRIRLFPSFPSPFKRQISI